ncbi:MAG: hypothetical protein L0287_03465 [Anaerolineae bacterium]|nr:hypothetical protein [Anaerolineae bacterium]MCI0609667.1 hypothetical protein [Anaerolineae bacterium]
MRILVSLMTLWVFVFSTGCQTNPVEAEAREEVASSPIPVPLSQSQGDTEQMTPSLSTSTSSGLESLIEKAKEDLAQRLSISVTQISLVQAAGVVWPDSSMGCPQPGMVYLQVPEDGALIILQADGKVYKYHYGGSRGLFLCEMVYKDPDQPPLIDIFNLTPRAPDSPTPDNSIPPGEDK